jgi:hypothetical protein
MAALYTIKAARAIAAVPDAEKTRFVVGSLCLREENQVHVLDYDEGSNSVRAQLYGHKNEVWHVAPSPTNAGLLATCYGDSAGAWAAVWAALRGAASCACAEPARAPGKGHRASLWRYPASIVPKEGCVAGRARLAAPACAHRLPRALLQSPLPGPRARG